MLSYVAVEVAKDIEPKKIRFVGKPNFNPKSVFPPDVLEAYEDLESIRLDPPHPPGPSLKIHLSSFKIHPPQPDPRGFQYPHALFI